MAERQVLVNPPKPRKERMRNLIQISNLIFEMVAPRVSISGEVMRLE